MRLGIASCANSRLLVRLAAAAGVAAVCSPATTGDLPSTRKQTVASDSLTLHQHMVEGWKSTGLDLEDHMAVFAHVFSVLPEEATVYPSEGYFYFILHEAGREIWGNIRLSLWDRELRRMGFAYCEMVGEPVTAPQRASWIASLSGDDGVVVTPGEDSTCEVSYRGKRVLFRFHRLLQSPPAIFPLRDTERFVQRTFDESGCRFFLLFDTSKDFFIWVLDEEDGPPEVLDAIAEDVVVGRRTGFAYWVDRDHGDRKVLAGVRKTSARRNDFYDGPFDQLADDYATESGIADYLQRAYRQLRGRIDAYGRYLDADSSMRFAIDAYLLYQTPDEVIDFIQRAKASSDPWRYISRRGVPPPRRPDAR